MHKKTWIMFKSFCRAGQAGQHRGVHACLAAAPVPRWRQQPPLPAPHTGPWLWSEGAMHGGGGAQGACVRAAVGCCAPEPSSCRSWQRVPSACVVWGCACPMPLWPTHQPPANQGPPAHPLPSDMLWGHGCRGRGRPLCFGWLLAPAPNALAPRGAQAAKGAALGNVRGPGPRWGYRAMRPLPCTPYALPGTWASSSGVSNHTRSSSRAATRHSRHSHIDCSTPAANTTRRWGAARDQGGPGGAAHIHQGAERLSWLGAGSAQFIISFVLLISYPIWCWTLALR